MSITAPSSNCSLFNRFIAVCVGCCVFITLGMDGLAESDNKVLFETKVLPLLKMHCYGCHSHASGKAKGGLVLDSKTGWQKGGGLGPALAPGSSENSLLIQAVKYDGLEMPPSKQLAPEEIEILERWVENGAYDNRESAKIERDEAALWALEPIADPAIPKVTQADWVIDPVDSFVLSKLEEHGIRPSHRADKHVLLRRVTFDLTGLPPTPDEIKAFLNDISPQAYSTVVDRLLDSPGFGDHWARHWFDLSCYADVQRNTLIGDAWRYRDYVIKSLNNDKPFNQFIHEQVAGDLLPYTTVAQKREFMIAAGYLSIGPWVIENYIKPQLAADIVDHQIDRIGKTFLGQTVSCARCHDHKFDPIPTRDYYALAGIFHSSLTTEHAGPGVWSKILEHELPTLPRSEAETQRARNERVQLEDRLLRLQHEIRKWYHVFPEATDANVLMTTGAISANEKGIRYVLSFEVGPTVWAAAGQATQEGDSVVVELLDGKKTTIGTMEVFPGEWQAKSEVPDLKVYESSYVGNGHGAVRIRISSGNPGSKRFSGALDNMTITKDSALIFEERFNSLIKATLRGQQAHTNLAVVAQAQLAGWAGLGINQSHLVEKKPSDYALQIFGGSVTDFKKLQQGDESTIAQLKQAAEQQAELIDVETSLSLMNERLQPEFAMSLTDIKSPVDIRVYRRGDFNLLGDKVPRGVLGLTNFARPVEIPEGQSGRLQLAHWLTAKDNTLTARVLSNRIWHHLFGRGIVPTVDYFGVHGERPSHPQLLDHLAIRFRDQNKWSLKATIRQLVLSNTYQMSSVGRSSEIDVDPDNRLLWRMNRRRLSGESIRDAMLQISGTLDPSRGGSPLGLELEGNIRGAGGNVNPPSWGGKIPDYVRNRRTVYQPLKRAPPAGDLEILTLFNFPHPNDISGSRPQTTVATQALFLMNSPFVKEQATRLSERIHKACADDESARLRMLYLLVAGRPPSDSETELSVRFIDSLATPNKQGFVNPVLRMNAWEQLCHGLLVSNNFLFKE